MKRTKEIYRDDRWLVVKPLTLNASIKYGYNTKWCTASKDNPLTFYKYSKEGILIYVIERKTNIKWAVYWEINEVGKKCEMSWWNAEDDRLDSMLVIIPEYIMSTIKSELFLESQPNLYYFSENQKNNYKKLKRLKEAQSSTLDSSSHDWAVYRNEGEWHQTDITTPITYNYKPIFDVDNAVRKTLEHKYISEAYMELIKQESEIKEGKLEEDS
jgi:hypothetical protein|tara:strand:+ start:4829 stop:5470 length:642 start_codon:yes stop_codon:yes gene_type:complete